jgi:carbonic anhydrase
MHICDSIVISCIDFRFVSKIRDFADKNIGRNNYDRVAVAGGVYDFYTVLKQVEISNKFHKIKKVVLLNHEDCAAYGTEGNFIRHKNDLLEAERKIEALFPRLDVETYYIKLDGEFVEMSKTHPRTK